MKKILSLTVAIAVLCTIVSAQVAVGGWRDCLDYSTLYHVSLDDGRILASARGGLFAVNLEDNSLSRLNKTTVLNDVGIATFAHDAQSGWTVVGYNNGNIDLLRDDKVYNVSDVKRNDNLGNKSLYNIRFFKGHALVCYGFGVVVVNLQRQEVKETWFLGENGGYTAVYDLCEHGDSIYAATGEGLKRALSSEQHLDISNRWAVDRRYDSLRITMLESIGDRLLLGVSGTDNDTVVLLSQQGQLIRGWNRGVIRSVRVCENRVLVSRDNGVAIYDATLMRIDSVSNFSWGTVNARDAVVDGAGNLWVATDWAGLLKYTHNGDATFQPAGPLSGDNVTRLVPFNYRMMLCPGGHTFTYDNAFLPPNLSTAIGSEWYLYDRSDGWLEGATDLVDAAVNPIDTHEVVVALWGTGVASVRDGRVVGLYDETNTQGAMQPYVVDDYRSLRSGAVAFSDDGDLWVLNSHQPQALSVRHTDGSWQGFGLGSLAPAVPFLDKMLWDSVNRWLWFCGNGNDIYVHDGVSQVVKVNGNRGSKLTTETIGAIAQDQNGYIWIGTNKGIKVIYDGYKAFDNGSGSSEAPVNCTNITITNGQFYEYLMAYESITAIAIDGANRKWIGTASGGVYLISANGQEQLLHFTAANSPLFSDKIVCLGVQPRTGEVYIGTDYGVQVYRGTATYAEAYPLDHVYAYPNPVRPGYEGTVAIKGFSRNGLAHITDAAGHVVWSGTAEGGQVVWNQRTPSGRLVASGIYYVFVSDAAGGNRAVAKVVIVR